VKTISLSPQPQRWITEISADGAVRHIQRLAPDHLVIALHDLPNVLSDRVTVSDALADASARALMQRAG